MTDYLPESFRTEQALLDALLTEPQRVIRDCWAAGLQPTDFRTHRHEVIYTTIAGRLRQGEDVDEISLIDQLRRDEVTVERNRTANALQYVGGSSAIVELSRGQGIVALARNYADEIVAQANSRELVLIGEQLAVSGKQLAPIPEAVSAAERRLARARDRAEGRHDGARDSDIGTLVERFVTEYLSDEPDDTIPFDLPSLNTLGGGMFPGDVVVVGARSGVGKSWSGLAGIERTVQAKKRCALFSIEMPAAQMVRRLIAMGGHNLTGIRRRLTPHEQIEARTIEVGNWTGLLDVFDGATNMDRIQGVLASARIDGNPYRLVVVDHVHLLDVPGSGDNYRLNLNAALTQAKHMAVEHGVTLVLLAQLRRPSTNNKTNAPLPRPTKHDLRESGGLGDIADYVLLLHRDEDEDGGEMTTGAVIVDKVRDGSGTGDIDVRFDTKRYRFVEDNGFMAGMPNATREIA